MKKRVFTAAEKKNQNSIKYNLRKKKYRLANKLIRNKSRKNNYSKTKPKCRHHRSWTQEEIMYLNRDAIIPDTVRSIIINRSVQAIQQKRYKIKKGELCA